MRLNRFFQKQTASLLLGFSFIIMALFSSCSQPKVNPDLLIRGPEDLKKAEFPPSTAELTYQKQYILPLITARDSEVTEPRLAVILSFLEKSFLAEGDIYSIEQETIQTILQQEKFQGFQPSNIPDALELGREVKANFLAQIAIATPTEKTQNPNQHFKADLDLSVFSVSSGQLAFRETIPYASQSPQKAAKALKKIIQIHFPLTGYILETRGNHQVARISLGRSAGIKLDRKFFVRERQVKSELVNGIVRKTISFPRKPLAVGTVIRVEENEAWLLFEKKDRPFIREGQVIFAKPESTGMF